MYFNLTQKAFDLTEECSKMHVTHSDMYRDQMKV